VEEKESLLAIAQALAQAGVHVLRGGAFKARTSPYTFQGIGERALDWLAEAKALTGLPLCVEILSETHLSLYEERGIDLPQIGARNMDNYWLLREVAALRKPVLLKRNPQATLEEWLLAAEYLLLHGTPWVFLCERGIRTFERSLRYTLDVGIFPALARHTALPRIADPSHAAGQWPYVEPLALAAVAAGAEGLLIEVHPETLQARSDPAQQLTVEQFYTLLQRVEALYGALSATQYQGA
jgi:3-deoxy-7-phosphoheptulonate synthase